MKKQLLSVWLIAGSLIAAPATMIAQGPPPGPPPPRGGSSGVRLATDIVNLVRSVVEPRPAVVVTPAPAPVTTVVYQQPAPATTVVYQQPATTVVYDPAPATYEYRYYNGSYVVYHSGWYWYHNAWVWGGRGAPPPRPGWRPGPPPPHYRHHPAPPPRPGPPPHHR